MANITQNGGFGTFSKAFTERNYSTKLLALFAISFYELFYMSLLTYTLIGIWESASVIDLPFIVPSSPETPVFGACLDTEWSPRAPPEEKTIAPQSIFCFHTTSASLLFQSNKILMTFTPSLVSSICPRLQPPPFLFCGFPFFFFSLARPFFFSLIGKALFEIENLFTLTAKAFG